MFPETSLQAFIGGLGMAKVRTANSRQVVIPKKFWDLLHLKAGDFFDVQVDKEKQTLIFTLQDVVNKAEAERVKWIKGLIQAGKENPVELEEDEITLDKNIKKQLFKEKYGPLKKND